MGKKKKTKKQETVTYQPIAQPTAQVDAAKVQEQQVQLQQQYQQQVQQIQNTSQQSIESINQSNQQAMAAIQAQLEASNREKLNYQQSLQEYLKQMQEMQTKYSGEIASRDAAVNQQREMQTRDLEANNTMNNLLTASSIAQQAFMQKTRRRGVIV